MKGHSAGKYILYLSTAVFLSSSYIVFTAHSTGYFDHFLEILTIASIVAIHNGRFVLVPLLIIVGLAIHEMFAIYGLPLICFALYLKLFVGSPSSFQHSATAFLKVIVPGLLFGGVLFWSQELVTPKMLQDIQANANQYEAMSQAGVKNMVKHLDESVFDSWNLQIENIFMIRLLDVDIAKSTYPSLFALLCIGSYILLQGRLWFPFLGYVLVTLLPILLHLLAWDMARFANFTLFNAYIGIFAVTLILNRSFSVEKKSEQILGGGLILAIINSLIQPVPLMADRVDRSGLFSLRTTIPSFIFYQCKPLFKNSTFDIGTFQNWTPQGTAFTETSQAFFPSSKNLSAMGRFWMLSFSRDKIEKGILGDAATGKLVSKKFKITRDTIIFKVAGGHQPEKSFVALYVDGKEIGRETGNNSEELESRYWDVERYRGMNGHIELVDNSTEKWGHISVDHFCWLR
jgi:hypothetical protein